MDLRIIVCYYSHSGFSKNYLKCHVLFLVIHVIENNERYFKTACNQYVLNFYIADFLMTFRTYCITFTGYEMFQF